MSLGIRPASRKLGIPPRSVANWLRRPSPETQAVVLASRDQLAADFQGVVQLGVAALRQRITDPKARLGDIARAVEVAAEQAALLTGGATRRVENLEAAGITTQDRENLLEWLDRMSVLSDAELRDWAFKGGLEQIQAFNPLAVARKRLAAGGDIDG